ncbi:MAG: GIY-YIG nuclease family protein [Thiothrix sp.]|nr:MAG: GIY-YIG nuclease family protein [Thiothrix sp.]
MKPSGKTIQIYLPDGNPRSIKIADITSRTVAAILIPRAKLEDAAQRNELNQVGVYILFGQQEGRSYAYIGEAENSLNRLKQHNREKEFWDHALVFISKTHYFTKTHIKFLECLCCDLAKKAGRYTLNNGNNPPKPHLSESAEADLYDNFETIKILAGTLDYPIFDELIKPKTKEIIICKGKDAQAEGEYTEEGLVVFANSICNLELTKTAGDWAVRVRAELLAADILKQKDNILVFQKDYVFTSPSGAAAIVLGRAANGWVEWKYKDGRTLDQVKRQSQVIEQEPELD